MVPRAAPTRACPRAPERVGGGVRDSLGSRLRARLDETPMPMQLASRSDEEPVRQMLGYACVCLRGELSPALTAARP